MQTQYCAAAGLRSLVIFTHVDLGCPTPLHALAASALLISATEHRHEAQVCVCQVLKQTYFLKDLSQSWCQAYTVAD